MSNITLDLTSQQAEAIHTALNSIRTGVLSALDRHVVMQVTNALHEYRRNKRREVRETITTTTVTTTRIIE